MAAKGKRVAVWNRFKLEAWVMILMPVAVLLIGLGAAIVIALLKKG